MKKYLITVREQNLTTYLIHAEDEIEAKEKSLIGDGEVWDCFLDEDGNVEFIELREIE